MRIVTYNIRGSLGMDSRRSTERISSTVRGLSPDAICFQEVQRNLYWSGGEDQPALLSAQLGRRLHFQPCLNFGFGGFGNAIAFRDQRHTVTLHPLPGRKEPRGLLQVTFPQIGILRDVSVFCTHWGLNAEERIQQAKICASILQQTKGTLFFCGDLNEVITAEAASLLCRESNLLDAGAFSSLPTFPSDRPNVRIDFLLHSPNVRVAHFEVITSLASDHLPLLADFEPI